MFTLVALDRFSSKRKHYFSSRCIFPLILFAFLYSHCFLFRKGGVNFLTLKALSLQFLFRTLFYVLKESHHKAERSHMFVTVSRLLSDGFSFLCHFICLNFRMTHT
jgi:hypothetical protein